MFSLLGSRNLQGREGKGRRVGEKERKRDRVRQEDREGDRHWGRRTQKYDKGIRLERKHGSK